MSIYIAACKQISAQQPLCEEWFDNPIIHTEPYVRAIDPDFKTFISPIAARRMGLILKRAVATSTTALQEARIENPDAIITATGLGCINNTEIFLKALTQQGESCLQPTYFINSTHNTIGSYIAVQRHCHAYNNTHVHRGISFESAILDAVMQFELGKINNALVGAHDEMTPDYFNLLQRVGFWKGTFAGETAMSMVLKREGEIELAGINLLYKPSTRQLVESAERLCVNKGITLSEIDLIVTGRSQDPDNNKPYQDLEEHLALTDKSTSYKHIFGHSFTSSAYGLYYAYECLRRGRDIQGREVHNILLYNHFENKDHSLTLLTR